MIVELISVGTEILLGNTVNTNVSYLAERCAELGLSLYNQVVVGDNEERLGMAIKTAIDRADILILTGGLGPTKDDLTKEVVAKVLNKSLIKDEYTTNRIKEYFKKGNHKVISENNWKQAEIIEGAIVVDNYNGTAPGLIVETEDNKRIILLPGPPNEMKPMFSNEIFSYLNKLQPMVIFSRMVKICGIAESMVDTLIEDLITSQTNPTIAPYAKTGEVHLRITARETTIDKAKKIIEPVITELKNRFKENIYTINDDDSLEQTVVDLLIKNNLTITTAESCTGGLLSGRLVNVPGISEVFRGGFITYSDKSKRKYLDVSKSTIEKHGAVSEKVAKEMVKGVAISTNSDTAIAVTGIAGPGGGTETKPVGLVYIACYVNEQVVVKEYRFKGNREKIRENTVVSALDLIRRCILEHYI